MRIAPHRLYDPKGHDDHKWVWWRWRDIYTPGSSKLYLRRLYILRCPWRSFMLHWIKEPDSDRWLHDHPWRFWSFVVRGWYEEQVVWLPTGSMLRRWIKDYGSAPKVGDVGFTPPKSGIMWRKIRWFNRKKLNEPHRITYVKPGTITFVITAKKEAKWGFYTYDGFVYWRDYLLPEHY